MTKCELTLQGLIVPAFRDDRTEVGELAGVDARLIS